MLRKVLKYLLWLIFGILILIVLLLSFTQTASFRRIVANKAEQLVGESLNAELYIGKINGNFYQNTEIQNVVFVHEQDTLLRFSSLFVSYNLWSLKNKKIEIDTVRFTDPEVSIKQHADSSWNFSKILPEPTKEKEQKEKSPFPFEITVKQLDLQHGNLHSEALLELIPDSILDINLSANAFYSEEVIQTNLHHFSFNAIDPSINLEKFSTRFKMDNNGMRIDSFQLQTTHSKIIADGNYQGLENLSVRVETDPAGKQDISIFVPSFKLACSPRINAAIISENSNTAAEIELTNNKQAVSVKADLKSLGQALKDKSIHVPYKGFIQFKNVVPEDWLVLDPTSVQLNGKINFKGEHLFNYQLPIEIDANLANSKYLNTKIDRLKLRGRYRNNRATSEFELSTRYGSAFVKAELSEINRVPKYDVTVVTDSFNLNTIVPSIKGTVLNSEIKMKGKGSDVKERNLSAVLFLHNSSAYHIPLDTAVLEARMQKEKIVLDTLHLKVKEGTANATGNFDLQSKLLEARADLSMHDSLSFLKQLVDLPLQFDSLQINAGINGPLSDLDFSGKAAIESFKGYSAQLKNLSTEFEGRIKKDSFLTSTNFTAIEALAGTSRLDTVTAEANYFNNVVSANVHALWNDTLDAKFRTRVDLGDTLTIHLPELDAKTYISHLFLNDSLASVELSNQSVYVRNLWIKDRSQPNFNLKLEGDLALKQTDKIALSLENLDIGSFNNFIPLSDTLSGIVTTDVELSGTESNPALQGNLSIENPGFGSISFSALNAEIDFKDQQLNSSFSLPGIGKSIDAYLKANMRAYFDSTGFVFDPPETFEARLVIDSLNVSQPIRENEFSLNARGTMNMDITATGKPDNPQIFGFLKMEDGSFSDRKYGLQYDEIDADIQFDGNRVNLKQFIIKQKEGSLTAKGELAFDSTMIKGKITGSTLTMDAKGFYLSRNRNYEIQIDANTFLKNTGNKPEFGGTVKVLRSNFYLPAIRSEMGSGESEIEEPLLIQALKEEADTLLSDTVRVKKKRVKKKQNSVSQSLTGRLRLDIPRNTWIKSEDMNLELSGEVDVVNTESFFELFGTIGIRRGHYILYGKKFNIERGELIFQGGIKVDPMLNLSAIYTYRGANKQKRNLELNVTGKLSEPVISFTLDGAYVSEYDAVSVLVFGKTSNEMNYEGQNGLVGSVSSNMVAQMISSQLNKTLGSTLNLDMIEINSTGNWQSAAFVVGKYITNDLFVIYQRGFGEREGDEITPETITLEYEINRLLFLRLQSGSARTSGFDVILKFEPKRPDITP